MSIKKDIKYELSMSSKDNINLKIALEYARLLGWTVLPIHSFRHEKKRSKKHNQNLSLARY